MSVEADHEVLAAGDDGRGRLVLRNGSPERTGPLRCGQPLACTVTAIQLGGYRAVGGDGL